MNNDYSKWALFRGDSYKKIFLRSSNRWRDISIGTGPSFKIVTGSVGNPEESSGEGTGKTQNEGSEKVRVSCSLPDPVQLQVSLISPKKNLTS